MENEQKTPEEKVALLTEALEKINKNESKIYFITPDTQGTAMASVAVNYEWVKILNENNYNAFILYDKKDYKPVTDWLGEEYSSLPHAIIEQDLAVGVADYVIIPEKFGHILEQTNNMPCTRIMLCQSYDYKFDTLQPGFSWGNYGINHCITTTTSQKEYLEQFYTENSLNIKVVTPSIPEYFKKTEEPKKPIISIHTRDPRDTVKIIKSFYIKFPQYRWVTFRDIRNISRKAVSESLSESCVSVWGTFPLESMQCGTPVIGLAPTLKPDWLTENNGLWTFEYLKIVDMIGAYMKNWLEDTLPEELYYETANTPLMFSQEKEKNSLLGYFESIKTQKVEDINMMINKLSPVMEEAKN